MLCKLKSFWVLLLHCLAVISLSAQESESVIDKTVNLIVSNVSLSELTSSLEDQTGVRFFYDNQSQTNARYSLNAESISLKESLDQVFKNSDFSYMIYRDYGINIVPAFLASEDFSASYFQLLEDNLSEENQTRRTKYDGIIVGEIENLKPSGVATVSGIISDSETRERIIGATIQWQNTQVAEVTDFDGAFVTEIPVGEHILEVQYIGYQTQSKKVKVLSDGSLRLDLPKEAITLEEIVISERAANDKVENAQISVDRLSVKDIKKLPAFLGEADVIQSILLQPGVSSVGEGAIGFNVRGGDVDQNLIIQDEAMIFNTSHALGFFSTFNTDLIKGVDLYKGNIPAQFGGRLASVMDVEMRDGNFDDYKLKAGVGVVSAKLAFEGPIKKGKTSFITGFRTSYSDWILNAVSVEEVKNSSASFYDWNGRITHRFSDKSSLILGGYLANDKFIFNNEFGFDYSTRLGQVIYKNAFSSKILSNTSLAYSTYNSTQNDIDSETPTNFENEITYLKFKEHLTINPSGPFRIETGLSSILYMVNPGERIPTAAVSENLAAQLDEEQALESAAFVDLKVPISDKFSISAGVRLSLYQNIGTATVLNYDPDLERRIENVIDTTFFDGGVIQSYNAIEPRASIRYSLGDNSSIKAGYSRTAQYINQIFNTDSPTPTSQWQLSTTHIKPTRSHNLSLGYFQNFNDNNFETSISIFGRRIDDLFDYRDFADLLVNDHIETELLEGEGRAYGMEFSMKKKTGVINGTLSYTYSRSQRLVEGISRNQWYSSNFDKPHEGSLVLNYQPNQRNTLSLNLVYAKGRPTTPPIAGYTTPENVFVPIFAERNQLRVPDYQRLDLAYTMGEGYKKDKKFRLSWTFSLYNLFGRENAYSVFFTRGAFNLPRAKKLAILGNVFPALTFNIELL